MRQMKVSELVLDFNFYPRSQVGSQRVRMMCDAREAGAEFPPVLVDKKSKRVIDGFGRVTMTKQLDGPDGKVDVQVKEYADEKAMLLDAVRLNASHGTPFTPFDRTRALILADQLKVDRATMATALQITSEKAGELRVSKTAFAGSKKTPVPIKRTIGHMAGKRLNKSQEEANVKLSGMNQLFYVNQLITLIEADLLDKENEDLLEGLRKLNQLLDELLAVA